MGKLKQFQLKIDNGRQVFYPGELVTGALHVTVSEPMKCNKIKVQLEGQVFCRWETEDRDQEGNPRTEEHCAKEELIDIESRVFGEGSSGLFEKSPMHPPGQHIYQFAFQLPAVLPSSYEGSYGHIRYYVEAKVDRPWKFDHKVKLPISINEVIDINRQEYQFQPTGTKNKEVGLFCCKAGKVGFSASLDRSGYCPGEQIYINATVDNQSTRDMKHIKAKLIQHVKYHASDDTKHETRTISRYDGPSIPQGTTLTWDNQPFHVPCLPPTIQTCRVIQVWYVVKLEVDIPMGFDPEIYLPITLGTIPFRPKFGMQQSYQLVQNQFIGEEFANWQALGPPPTAPPPPAQFFTGMPPPSYGVSVGQQNINIADGDEKVNFGDQSYTPMYTFAQPYAGNLPQPPAPTPGVQPVIAPPVPMPPMPMAPPMQ